MASDGGGAHGMPTIANVVLLPDLSAAEAGEAQPMEMAATTSTPGSVRACAAADASGRSTAELEPGTVIRGGRGSVLDADGLVFQTFSDVRLLASPTTAGHCGISPTTAGHCGISPTAAGHCGISPTAAGHCGISLLQPSPMAGTGPLPEENLTDCSL